MSILDVDDPFDQTVERPVRDEDRVPRDRWRRPEILLPDGSGVAWYTSITTLIKSIDSTYALNRYNQRLVAEGMIRRPDLQLEYAATMPLVAGVSSPEKETKTEQDRLAWLAQLTATDDVGAIIQALRKALEVRDVQDEIIDRAREAAGGNVRANVGTELHALTERHDLGLDIGYVPEAWRADLRAYIEITAPMRPVEVEGLVVVDEFRCAGTPDRIMNYPAEPCPECESTYYAFEIKSGKVDFSPGTIARQQALGAHGLRYDAATRTRFTRLWPVCLHRGILLHLAAGTGRAETQWTDIASAWETIKTCYDAHRIAARKKWTTPFVPVAPVDPALQLISGATSSEEVLAIARAYRESWTEAHTYAARERLAWIARTTT